MKALIISAAFPPLRGGESDHMLHLATRLSEQGIHVDLLTVEGAEISPRFPFTVHPIMGDWSWSELPRLVRCIRTCAPDAVLLKYSGWLYNEHPMITFAPTISRWFRPSAPFVTQFGFAGASNPEKTSHASRAVRRLVTTLAGRRDVNYGFGTLLRDSDSLIALGEVYASMLSSLQPGVDSKLVVVPPPPILHMVPGNDGESRRRGREMLGVKADDFVVAYFGVIYRSKGLETLLTAFRDIAARRSNARLALIGGQSNAIDGATYFNNICELGRSLQIEDRIVAREYEWDSTDGSLYLWAADLCVLPFDDGVSMIRSSVAGAVAHGLPIVTTAGKVVESAFADGRNVLLCRPKDPEGLAKAIERVADDCELRRRLSEGALEMSRDWFSWDKAVRQTIATFKRDRRSPRPSLSVVRS